VKFVESPHLRAFFLLEAPFGAAFILTFAGAGKKSFKTQKYFILTSQNTERRAVRELI
jgi:hypothetical protein